MAYTRSGANERTFRSPGRPPTTSIDSEPVRSLTTQARNSHVDPRPRTPSIKTGSPARSPCQVSERRRCAAASAAARLAEGRGATVSLGDRNLIDVPTRIPSRRLDIGEEVGHAPNLPDPVSDGSEHPSDEARHRPARPGRLGGGGG